MTIPLGLYETLLTEALADSLREADLSRFESVVAPLDPGNSCPVRQACSRRSAARPDVLSHGRTSRASDLSVSNQVIELLNAALGSRGKEESGDRIVSPVGQLLAFLERKAGLGVATAASRPAIPLATSDLLMNARGEPALGHVLAREFPSADRVDLLCAFIRWNGLRVLEEPLRVFRESEPSAAVLTTTYTGSTERRALDKLVELGRRSRVSYDTQ